MVEGQWWTPGTWGSLNKMPGQVAESPGQLEGQGGPRADTAERSSCSEASESPPLIGLISSSELLFVRFGSERQKE